MLLEMGKGSDPSPRKRGKVESLLTLGTIYEREIAKSVGLSKTAVHTIKKELDFAITSSPKRSSCGRKAVVTPRVKRVLLQECRKNRKLSSKQLQGTLEQHNIKVSTSSVRRHLVQSGFVARWPRKKPLLNSKQQSARLQCAKEHRNWTSGDRGKVNVVINVFILHVFFKISAFF